MSKPGKKVIQLQTDFMGQVPGKRSMDEALEKKQAPVYENLQ